MPRNKKTGGLVFKSKSGGDPRYYAKKQEVEMILGHRITTGEFEQFYYEQGTDTGDVIAGGTSVFDPVLCEAVYRWFCPPGGTVLDPFAGGSVRGIVAAACGLKYTGIELRTDQIAANRAQAGPTLAKMTATSPAAAGPGPDRPPTCETIKTPAGHELVVVRDDLLPGGTKRRVLKDLLRAWGAEEYVYASPVYGYAQVGLALAARDLGLKATVFCAKRRTRHFRTQAAERFGAKIMDVDFGRLNVVEARAKAYAAAQGAHLLPFGLKTDEVIAKIAEIAISTRQQPKEVWCVAGSGVLSRGLQMAWPTAKHHAVLIGGERADVGKAEAHRAPEKFEDVAAVPPPFPSCREYDAKAWGFIKHMAAPGALFWNVAADEAIAEPLAAQDAPAPRWLAGDSRKLGQIVPRGTFDLVFSCPPYYDLERYSDDPADLSNAKTYEDFRNSYDQIIHQAVDALADNRFACFVVSNIRDDMGFLRDLVAHTTQAFESAGARLYNEAILITPYGSLPIRVGEQFGKYRKLGKTHQNVLVYFKGDPKRIKEIYGEIATPGH